MSRGGQTVLKNQLGTTQKNQATAQDQASGLFGTLKDQYSDVAKNPVSTADKTAITGGTLQPLAESFDASGQSATNMVGRTKNDAGYQASLDKLAQQRGSETAKANQSLQTGISDLSYNRKMGALGAQQGMYGTAQGAAVGYGGQSTQTANNLAQIQNRPGFWGTLGTDISRGIGNAIGGG